MFWRKAKWMLVTIIVPELILGNAVKSFFNSRRSSRAIQEFLRDQGCEDEVEWTLTHSMYADLGGFFIKFPPGPDRNINDPGDTTLDPFIARQTREHRCLGRWDWDVHGGRYILARGFLDQGDNRENIQLSEACYGLIGSVWVPTARQLL
jgi:hypothetical protein